MTRPEKNNKVMQQSPVSRTDAEKIIRRAYGLPRAEAQPFYWGRFMVTHTDPSARLDAWVERLGKGEKLLLSRGIRSAKIVSESKSDGIMPLYTKVIDLSFTTDTFPRRGVSYPLDQGGYGIAIPLVTYKLGKIISLRSLSDNEYKVVYSLDMQTTEPYFEAYRLGIAIPNGSSRRVFYPTKESLQQIKQRIVKYDDGW